MSKEITILAKSKLSGPRRRLLRMSSRSVFQCLRLKNSL
jgi:hypothetical protein